MAHLLILASGGGTRCQMFTYNNAMPKVLMSVGDKTCLEAIIDSYDKCNIEHVFIACLNEHKAQIAEILDFRGYENWRLLSYDAQPTAMHSLIKAVELYRQAIGTLSTDVYVNWSDVFMDAVPMSKIDTIFCDANYVHRNIAISVIGETGRTTNVISTADMHGNVPGIFHCTAGILERCCESAKHFSYSDFDKAFADIAEPKITYVSSIHDIGDFDKYSAYMQSIKQESVCRYFNEIEIDAKTVKKRPKTKKGEDLHAIELAYYRAFGNRGTALAKLLGYDVETKTMTLERIKGQTCQSFVDNKPENAKLAAVNSLVKKFKQSIYATHALDFVNKDTEQDMRAALIAEFSEAIQKRVEPCMHMINSVIQKNGIKSVDGMPIVSYDAMLDTVNHWLTKTLEDGWFEFGITHGDPNTDNSMVVKDGIRFVDPRGYFGKLKTLGLGVKQYDLAKFVYGFSGYSKLNRAEYIAMHIADGDVQFFVGPNELTGITDVSLFDINVEQNIKVLVGIIWVKLTSYIINDPVKAVAAYLYGNALLTKLLNIKD